MRRKTIDQSIQAPAPAVVHLSGSRRGTTQRLRGRTLRIGSAADEELHVEGEAVAEHHATLSLRGSTYEIRTETGCSVWVNGNLVDVLTLQSGDVLEIGKDGPVLRFRLYPPGSRALKSVAEVFEDCIDCARLAAPTFPARASVLLGGPCGS